MDAMTFETFEEQATTDPQIRAFLHEVAEDVAHEITVDVPNRLGGVPAALARAAEGVAPWPEAVSQDNGSSIARRRGCPAPVRPGVRGGGTGSGKRSRASISPPLEAIRMCAYVDCTLGT